MTEDTTAQLREQIANAVARMWTRETGINEINGTAILERNPFLMSTVLAQVEAAKATARREGSEQGWYEGRLVGFADAWDEAHGNDHIAVDNPYRASAQGVAPVEVCQWCLSHNPNFHYTTCQRPDGAVGSTNGTGTPDERGSDTCPDPAAAATTHAPSTHIGVAFAEPNSHGVVPSANRSGSSRPVPVAGNEIGATTSTRSPHPTIASSGLQRSGGQGAQSSDWRTEVSGWEYADVTDFLARDRAQRGAQSSRHETRDGHSLTGRCAVCSAEDNRDRACGRPDYVARNPGQPGEQDTAEEG